MQGGDHGQITCSIQQSPHATFIPLSPECSYRLDTQIFQNQPVGVNIMFMKVIISSGK